MSKERSEQELVRIEKLKAIREGGIAYPNDQQLSHTCDEALRAGEGAPAEGYTDSICEVAGRIVALRRMGKAAFCHIQDRSGRIQFYLRKDDLAESAFAEFKTMDLGDIVAVKGFPFTTRTGEVTLHLQDIRLLVKCLHPLPEKWHGLQDVETRYRQRYLDLIVSPEVKKTFADRARIISEVRKFFDEQGFIEVETPMMAPLSSGATAKPFITHHNALDLKLNMRIAPELYLKRLVVGGIERVYELGRVFRNEGLSTQHNPEFSMIEFYQAYATYETCMDQTEALIARLCERVAGKDTFEFNGCTVSTKGPWLRLTMKEAIYQLGGVSPEHDLETLASVHAAAQSVGCHQVLAISEWGAAFYELFDAYVSPKIVNPTFITKFPLVVSPLSRTSDDDSRFVDRFELFVAGMELANAFSELNDPEDQRQRFESQVAAKQAGDDEAMDLDEDYITALEYGLPPTAGEGIGIDRLVMLLTESASIRDVILFPQMRPRATRGAESEIGSSGIATVKGS